MYIIRGMESKCRIFVSVAFVLIVQVSGNPRVRRDTYLELWPGGIIPYVIPVYQFTEDEQKTIRVAMNRWEAITCLRFVPWTEESRQQMGGNRIEFYKGGTCTSSNGLVQSQPQVIGITQSCMSVAAIGHELGHTIGLIHTIRRSDRDAYVTVHYGNIKSEFLSSFHTTLTSGITYNLYGTVYDYSSIMHYKPTTWSKNGNVVIETKDPAYQSVIGHSTQISFYDSMWVNRAYRCNERCDRSKVCLNGGYVGGSNCRCICPNGFIGYSCEAPLPGYQKIITWRCPDAWTFANGRCYRIYPDVIQSYSAALNLCNNQDASLVTFETEVERDWLVKTLTELKYVDTTRSLWVGLRRNANDGWLGNRPFYQWLDGQTYNDSLMPIHDLASETDENCGSTDGQFMSIGSCAKKNNRGFICMKDFDTACGGRFRLRDREQYITSPGYPNDYTNGITCQYVIQTRRDRRVEISFEVFNIKITTGCQDDYMLVQKARTALDAGKKYCGSYTGLKNKTLVSDGNLMILTFRSDMRASDKGFKAKIKAIPLRFGGRDRGNPTQFLGSFYSVFSSNNGQTRSNSYLESAWNLFGSMSLSNILG